MFGELAWLWGADIDMACSWAYDATAAALLWFNVLLFRLEFGLLCILECLVSSSDLENFFEQPGYWHACGFSPVCVRMCRVWCSSLWKALSHRGHLYGLGSSPVLSCVGAEALGNVSGMVVTKAVIANVVANRYDERRWVVFGRSRSLVMRRPLW